MKTALAALAALFTLFRGFFALIALALSLMVGPALADAPATKWQWGCEWKQGANGNYLTKVDGGCRHFTALGHSNMADHLRDVPAPDDDTGKEPEPEAPEEPADKAV